MSHLPVDVPAFAEVARAVRSLPRVPRPAVLGFHPVARMNPFQALLYQRAYDHGFAPVPLFHRSDFGALRTAGAMGAEAVLHLHWTAEVTRGAASETAAAAAADEFIAELERLKDEGVKLVWTVHNVLPHGCDHPDVEAAMRSRIAGLADVIHVMNPSTSTETSRFYELPDHKVVQVPHPSYVGAYPSHHDRRVVRFELGFERGDLVVGLLGSIQPYKGVEEFVAALTEARLLEPRLRGLVAGIPGGDDRSAQLVRLIESDENVLSIPRRLEDGAIARLLTALDVLVLPYRASLNSGAALLGVTFGVPIIAPAVGHFTVLEGEGLVRTYPAEDRLGLAAALAEAAGTVAAYDPERARDYAEATQASVVSASFFNALRKAIDR